MAKRSRQDIESNFENFVVDHLKEKGYVITAYNNKDTQITKGDYRCVLNDRDFNLDHKCFHTVWSIGLCVELLQDSTPLAHTTQPNSLGWFYNLIECQFLVVGYHDETDGTLLLCVGVDLKRLRQKWDAVVRFQGRPDFMFAFSPKGFGSTVNIVIPWKTLDQFKLLSLMFKHDKQPALW